MQVPEKSQFISVNLQVDCLACGRQAGTGLQNGSSDSLCCWPAWLVLHGLDCLCLVIQYCYNSQNCPLSSLWRRTYSWHFNNNILWHFHILPGCLSEGLLNWSWKTPWKSQDPTCRAGAVGALQQVQPDEAEALPPLQPLRPLRQEDGPSLSLDLFVVRHELAIMRLAAFMGITMLVGITGLFYTQLIGIITDTTSIEKMSNCCEEISRPRKPWQQTFSEVFGTRWKILWFIPFRQRQPLRVPYHFANHV